MTAEASFKSIKHEPTNIGRIALERLARIKVRDITFDHFNFTLIMKTQQEIKS